MSEPSYWPHYCEENVWHLAAREPGALVVFISNPRRAVVLWCQRAATSPDRPVLWDYHVVLAAPTEQGSSEHRFDILDLDTVLGPRVAAERYLDKSFAGTSALPEENAPRFRVVPAERYRELLRSDRRHMRRDDGSYIAPPPPWPPIGDGGSNLMRFVDMDGDFEGAVYDLPGLRDLLAG